MIIITIVILIIIIIMIIIMIILVSVVQQRRAKRARKELMARIGDQDKEEEPKVVMEMFVSKMVMFIAMMVMIVMMMVMSKKSRATRMRIREHQDGLGRTESQAELHNS